MKLLPEIKKIRNQNGFINWGVEEVISAASDLLPKLNANQKVGLTKAVHEIDSDLEALSGSSEMLALAIMLAPYEADIGLQDLDITVWEQLEENDFEWVAQYVTDGFSAYDVETRYFVVSVMENFAEQENYHNVLVSVSASDVEQRMPLIQALAAMMPRNGCVGISEAYGDRCFEWDSGYIYRPMDSSEITESEWNVVRRFCPTHLVFKEDDLMADEDWIEIANQFLA